MTSPRELELGVLAPLAPYFARKVNVNTPGQGLTKYDTVEAQYEDINQQPTRAAGAGVTVISDVPVVPRRQRLLLENAVVTLATGAGFDYGSLKLVDLPDRNIAILQAELVGTCIFGGDYATNDDPDIAVGTAAASNVTLSSTMVNVIAKVDFDNITAGVATAVAISRLGATSSNATLDALNIGDAAGNALYLNVATPDTQLAADGTATFNGYFDFWYIDLGNVGS